MESKRAAPFGTALSRRAFSAPHRERRAALLAVACVRDAVALVLEGGAVGARERLPAIALAAVLACGDWVGGRDAEGRLEATPAACVEAEAAGAAYSAVAVPIAPRGVGVGVGGRRVRADGVVGNDVHEADVERVITA